MWKIKSVDRNEKTEQQTMNHQWSKNLFEMLPKKNN